MMFFYSLVFTALMGISVLANANQRGDEYRDKQFRLLCGSMITMLDMKAPLKIADRNIDIDKFKSKLKETKIKWTEQSLKVNENAVDAINFPLKNLIIINRSKWDSLEQYSKTQLCMHELWGLIFSDHQDDRYFYSSQMVNILRRSVLAETFVFAKCTPAGKKDNSLIVINIPKEFFLVLASNTIDDIPNDAIASYSQWVDVIGNLSSRTQSFLSISKQGYLVQRYNSALSGFFEELMISNVDTGLSLKKSYSEDGNLIKEEKYQCAVTL